MATATTKAGLLTTEQAAQMAGMSRQALQGHIDAGRIAPEVQIGRLRLFSRELIAGWLRDRKKNGVTKRGPQAKKAGSKRGAK
jgi:excisionase family DNA binding protein